jgi:excisionase family DNA binding protein
MPSNIEAACRFAIEHAKKQEREMITTDDLLLGCLRSISQFGIAEIGPWSIDLEALGFDWLAIGEEKRHKVTYSQQVVDVLDHATRIARSSESSGVRVQDLLVAFAAHDNGLMGLLKKQYCFTNAQWRASLAASTTSLKERPPAVSETEEAARTQQREYLTPEEAAEVLAIHVQTLRVHVRSGKLPALRLAGERAIRIRRSDLEKIFEPAMQAAD